MDNYLADWNEKLKEIEFHISLGEEEIVDAFENQKAKLFGFIDASREKVNELAGSEQATRLKTKLEELQVQLALGKAETRDAYEEQKKKLEKAVHEAKTEFDSATSDENMQKLSSDINSQFEKFRTSLDVFKLQFALGSADAREELSEKKEEIKHKIAELRVKADKKADEADEVIEEVAEELAEAYQHVKASLKKLFS